MNILPKKRWHVRTKDNIARVRRDEALAAEEERKKQQRLEKAEREAKREALRKKARELYGYHSNEPEETTSKPAEANSSSQHVNLFYELEENEIVSNKTNPEYEREKQLEKEKYEKQIGYLTYLGQDTNEITGKVSWYNKPREEILNEKEEVCKKQKTFEDPLEEMKKYIGSDGIRSVKQEKYEIKTETNLVRTVFDNIVKKEKHKKHKKDKKSKHKKKKKKKHSRKYSSESEVEVVVKKEPGADLERLRAERLKREREERKKAEELFARLNGVKKEEVVTEPVQKYNSQFNPHLAKQNYLN